jgi:hypothetical protein
MQLFMHHGNSLALVYLTYGIFKQLSLLNIAFAMDLCIRTLRVDYYGRFFNECV